MKKIKILGLALYLLFLITVSCFGGTRQITDMAGREVVLPDRVQRVVTTYKTATQFVFALGAGERLVAVDIGSPRQKLFTTLMPEIKNLPAIGSKRHGLNLEEIISTHPDLVILFPYKDGPVVAEKLKEQGIASIIIKPESLAEIRETNLLLGRALGLEEKAKMVDKEFEKVLQMVACLEELPSAKKKKVYFANSELLDTVGKGMLQTSMIELAGGINPASTSKKGFVRISREQLIAWNPDIVVVSQFYQGRIKDVKENPVYQGVKAFYNDQIYRFPSEVEPWDFPGPSSYLGVLWLAEKIHPERFAELDLDSLINNFYKTLYGRKFDSIE